MCQLACVTLPLTLPCSHCHTFPRVTLSHVQDPKFCSTYVRGVPFLATLLRLDPHSSEALVTLGGYMRFWGAAFAVVTLLLWLLKSEGKELSEEEERTKAQGRDLEAAETGEQITHFERLVACLNKC